MNVLFLVMLSPETFRQAPESWNCFNLCSPAILLLVGVRKLAIPTVVEQTAPIDQVSGKEAYTRVEAMVKFLSIASKRSSLGCRGWQEWIEGGETVSQRFSALIFTMDFGKWNPRLPD